MDKNSRTTIKLNGQSYNALSGKPLGRHVATGNIDGIVKRPVQNNYSVPSTANKSIAVPTKQRTAHHIAKKPAPTQTLMRSAVSKPQKPARLVSKATTPLSIERSSEIKAPTMVGRVNTKLATRAKTFPKSSVVSHFGAEVKTAITTKPAAAVSSPKPAASVAPKTDMFEAAIERATSHELPPLTKKELRRLQGKKPLSRTVSFVIAGFMVLAAISYIAYANMSNMMVKVADLRAGFSASMPDWRPTGFALASVGYQPGVVSFSFNSKTSNQSYTLTEHTSSWDSATLMSSVVLPTQGTHYKQLQVNGQTIYLYGKDQAAWVSNNIWYQLDGKGNLSKTQIAQLASTL